MLNRFASNFTKSAFFSLPFTSSLSTTMAKPKSIPAPTVPTAIKSRETVESGGVASSIEQATFASGCFWGTEHLFTQYYGKLPSFTAVAGYTGGKDTGSSPTYRQVCSGTTGHAEAVLVTFDKATVGYEELVEFFYRTHDPTTMNQQGADRGSQYRSAIFTHTSEQADIAKTVTGEVQDKYFSPKGEKIVTEITEATKWFEAEPYHINYLNDNPSGYQCPTHRLMW